MIHQQHNLNLGRYCVKLSAVLLIATLVWAASPDRGAARSINLNLYDTAGDADNNQLQSGEVAGVIPVDGSHWNNVGFAHGDLAGAACQRDVWLADDQGVSQALRFQSTLGSAYVGYSGAGSAAPKNGDRDLMTSYLSYDAQRDTGLFTFSGLSAPFTTVGYDVYIYFDTDRQDRTHTLTLTPEGNPALVIRGDDSGTFSGSFTEAVGAGTYANVAVFRNLTAGGFTLVMDSSSGRAAVNGVQVVTLDHPLPPKILSFGTGDWYLSPGASARLSWSTTGATLWALSPDLGDVSGLTTNGAGALSVTPSVTTTYTLTISNAAGMDSAQVRIGVGPPRPNILFFLVDDMGWQDTSEPFHYDTNDQPIASALNLRYRTPSMERLADQAMKFTQAYVSPVCTPTRVSLMTGMNATRHHVTTWTHPDVPQDTGDNNIPHLTDPPDWRKAGMDESDIPLPRLLQQLGYRTIHAGKAHFGPNGTFAGDPRDIGFDVNIAGHGAGAPGSYLATQNFGTGMWHVPGLEKYYGQDIFLTEALTLEMKAAIATAVAQDVPFFAYMAHYAVHAPFMDDARFTANYPTLSGGARAYATMIEGMDKSLGDLMDHLVSLGVAENTLVIFLSDNGGDAPITDGNAPLRGKKGTRFEGGVRVPLMIGWAKLDAANAFQKDLPIAPDTRCHAMVAGYDLFPTLLHFAGGQVSHPIDGYDLRPYLLGQPGEHRPQEYVVHFPHGHNNDHYSLIRQGDWKLILNYGDLSYELYNLADDLGETANRIATEPEMTMRLARRLARELDRMQAQYSLNLNTGSNQTPVMPALPSLDLDADGLPDLDEDSNRNGLLDDGETDPESADTDGDACNDFNELYAGTDPRDPQSRFALTIFRNEVHQVTLTWPGRTGRTYHVEQRSDLAAGDWTTTTNLAGIPSRMVLPQSADGDARFYRVVLP